MTSVRAPNGDVFEMERSLIEVTSNHRPDINWKYLDKMGHEHRWFVGDQPATSYRPEDYYVTPTLVWIFEEWGYYEDGERYKIGHHECAQCGEKIEPQYRADDCSQYIAGLARYRINGQSVSSEEFKARVEKAFPTR